MSLRALRRRVRSAGVVATTVFAVLGLRMAWLATFEQDAIGATAVDNALRAHRVDPPRGRILDRNGAPLADARPSVDLVVRPSDVQDPGALRALLSEHFGEDATARLDAALGIRGARRRLPRLIARDLGEDDVAWVAGRRHLLSGAELRASQSRTYPQGRRGAHLLGYLSEVGPDDLLRLDPTRYRAGDLIGRQGIEATLELDLRGIPGWTWRPVDALGRPADGVGPWRDRLDALVDARSTPAVAGADVVLTLDAEIQRAAEDALDDYTGAAVLLDVETGGLLAYASSPRFDPEELTGGVTASRWRELSSDGQLIDRVVRGMYPPASTFKVVTGAAALADGVADDFTVECKGSHRVGRRRFHCWKRGGHGVVDLVAALENSCDIWFYVVGIALGPEKLADAARRLGLGAPTGFGRGERSGLLPDADELERRQGRPWNDGDSASASIGQGMDLATPLQLAVMTAAVANGGDRVRPFIVDRVVTPDGATRRVGGSDLPEPSGFDEGVLGPIRAGLEAVMTTGTAKSSAIDGLPFAGKTGTAQVVSLKTKREHPGPETEDHALFVAYAPVEDPEVAVAVVLEHAGGGSAHAAPVARRILESWGRVAGILPPPDDADAEDATDEEAP